MCSVYVFNMGVSSPAEHSPPLGAHRLLSICYKWSVPWGWCCWLSCTTTKILRRVPWRSCSDLITAAQRQKKIIFPYNFSQWRGGRSIFSLATSGHMFSGNLKSMRSKCLFHWSIIAAHTKLHEQPITCSLGGTMTQTIMCREPWPDTADPELNPTEVQRPSEGIFHGAGFVFRPRRSHAGRSTSWFMRP